MTIALIVLITAVIILGMALLDVLRINRELRKKVRHLMRYIHDVDEHVGVLEDRLDIEVFSEERWRTFEEIECHNAELEMRLTMHPEEHGLGE